MSSYNDQDRPTMTGTGTIVLKDGKQQVDFTPLAQQITQSATQADVRTAIGTGGVMDYMEDFTFDNTVTDIDGLKAQVSLLCSFVNNLKNAAITAGVMKTKPTGG